MSPTLRSIGLVAVNELGDALRTRRALVVLLLYLALGVLTTNSAINVLQKIEDDLSAAMQLEPSGRPGTVTSAIWKSERFRRMVIRAVGDDSLVADLLGTPPIVLIFGALAFFYTPLLVVVMASPRVAEEVGSGAARYALVRTSRAAWSLGQGGGGGGRRALLLHLRVGVRGDAGGRGGLGGGRDSNGGQCGMGYGHRHDRNSGSSGAVFTALCRSVGRVIALDPIRGPGDGLGTCGAGDSDRVERLVQRWLRSRVAADLACGRVDHAPARPPGSLAAVAFAICAGGGSLDRSNVGVLVAWVRCVSETRFVTSWAIRWRSVVKRYGRRTALNGLTLEIPRDLICGLVGSNGAGKTTAFSVAIGLTQPDEGRVELAQGRPFDPGRDSGRLTLLPQDSDLPRDARPRELLAFYGMLQGLDRRTALQEANRLLELVHLTDRAASPVRTLSHGMRKRIMIAQCFIGAPEIVLLDEPLSGLDPREVAHMRDFIRQQRGRRTIVISSHNLHEIELLCDHVAFIEEGRLVHSGPIESVTGRKDVLVYELEPHCAVELESLATPDLEWDLTWNPETGELTCRFDATRYRVDEVNRHVVTALLAMGCPLIGIRRGERLEQSYLNLAGVGSAS